MIAVIAAQEVQSLRRQRVLLVVGGTIVAMTVMAGVIGWSSHDTIIRVYDEAVRLLAADGTPAPPNPFDRKPTLSMLSNLSIYVPLIGALLALVLGHLAMADDQADGIGRLLFSRRLSRTDYVVGKVVAVSTVLAGALTASWVVSVVSLLAVNRAAPTAGELGRLVAFYLLSWLYLVVFALVGMVTVLLSTRRSLALLAGLGVWLTLTFAVPQFTSGLRPTASLNPITDPVSTSQPFFDATAKARPLSLSEQYKTASAHILGTASRESGADTARRVVPLTASMVGLGLLSVRLVRRHDYSKGSSDA